MGESLCKSLLIYLPFKESQSKLHALTEAVEQVLRKNTDKCQLPANKEANSKIEGLKSILAIDIKRAVDNVKEEEAAAQELIEDQDISSSDSEQERNKIMAVKKAKKKKLPKVRLKHANADVDKSKVAEMLAMKLNPVHCKFNKAPRTHAVSECRKNFKLNVNHQQQNSSTDNTKRIAISSIKRLKLQNNNESYIYSQNQGKGFHSVSRTGFSLQGFGIKKFSGSKCSALNKYDTTFARHNPANGEYSSGSNLLSCCKVPPKAKLKLNESSQVHEADSRFSLSNVQSHVSRQQRQREFKTSIGQEFESLSSKESIIKKVKFARKFINPRVELKATKIAFTDNRLKKLAPINLLKK